MGHPAEGRITKVDGGATGTYVYDAGTWRVQRTSTTVGTSDYVYDLSGNPIMVFWQGGLVRGDVFIGSTHLATYFNGQTYFPHTNWQGSESVRTLANGTKIQECEWRAFGDLKGCTTGSRSDGYPFDYAGYEYDSETGNYHMPLRYYNPRIGRFLGVDQRAGNVFLPQTHNGFGYTYNNPINLIDPTGLCGFSAENQTSCDEFFGYHVSGLCVYTKEPGSSSVDPNTGNIVVTVNERSFCFSEPNIARALLSIGDRTQSVNDCASQRAVSIASLLNLREDTFAGQFLGNDGTTLVQLVMKTGNSLPTTNEAIGLAATGLPGSEFNLAGVLTNFVKETPSSSVTLERTVTALGRYDAIKYVKFGEKAALKGAFAVLDIFNAAKATLVDAPGYVNALYQCAVK